MKTADKIKIVGFAEAELTLEDLARAWASIDGKRDRFDKTKATVMKRGDSLIQRVDDIALEDLDGTYEGYTVEMHEIIRRANRYARIRGGSDT